MKRDIIKTSVGIVGVCLYVLIILLAIAASLALPCVVIWAIVKLVVHFTAIVLI